MILTGGAGHIGSKIADFLKSKGKTVVILDLSLGHDLTNESFTKDWFSKNHSKYLINCFAIDDRIITSKKIETFLNVDLSDVLRYFEVNTLALLSVCREFIRNPNWVLTAATTLGVELEWLNQYKQGKPKKVLPY